MSKPPKNKIVPRNEPEIMRAKGRRCVESNNEIARKPYGKKVYQALELAEQAYFAHSLPYEPGLSAMDRYPPDRFTWIRDDEGEVKECVKLRDDLTGRLVVWPHWYG
jgi:hypothetical protein